MAVGLKFDTTDLADMRVHFAAAAAGIRDKVLVRSVNKTAQRARTVAKRELVKAGGFRSAYVHGKLDLRRASGGSPNPTATITAADRHSTVARFSPSPSFKAGGKLRRAKPWGQGRTFKGKAFWISGRNGARLPVVRTGPRKGDLRVLYGPSVGREMARPDAQNPTRDFINDYLPRETARYARHLLHRNGRYF